MIARHVQDADFICVDTDARALFRSVAGSTVQLGASGLAAAQPTKGRDAAEMSVEQIREVIDGAQTLFIIAGMGGGTGSGAAPVIAHIAQEMGILTLGVVTKPAGAWETSKRMHVADVGLAELEPNVDSLIVLPLDTLFEMLGGEDLTQGEFFAHVNNVLKNLVVGIVHIINVTGP
jgi:cell division protein FtsZ